jgi:HTH-type transcriptional regulator/antitoxin HipB
VADYTIQTDAQLPLLLRGLRKSRGLSQAALAQRLGVAQQTISQMERNAATVTIQRLTKVLSILGAQLVLRDYSETLVKKEVSDRW